jgi:hypothetical protein
MLGGPQSRSEHRGYRKNPFASAGDRTSIAWSSSPYPDTILTELPGSIFILSHNLHGTERNYVNLSRVSASPCQDLKSGPPEYEAGVSIPLRPPLTFFVIMFTFLFFLVLRIAYLIVGAECALQFAKWDLQPRDARYSQCAVLCIQLHQ